jgi:ferredoxin
MLHSLLPSRIFSSKSPLFQRSRCLRMRHRNSGCTRCLDSCPRQALDFARDPVVDGDACNACYQCTASCPTEALTPPDFDFSRYLHEIKTGEAAVIGCDRSPDIRHTALPCLGVLSDIHLLVLSLTGIQITIDIEPCRNCDKGQIADELPSRLARLRSLLPPKNSDKIQLLESRSAGPPASRRDFFAAFKLSIVRQVSSAIPQESPRQPAAFADKRLPGGRQLLNEFLQSAVTEKKDAAIKAFYSDLAVTEACNLCFTCTAACPTGALRKQETAEARRLLFQSALCCGCGLCLGFCRHRAILLQPSVSATELFNWRAMVNRNRE